MRLLTLLIIACVSLPAAALGQTAPALPGAPETLSFDVAEITGLTFNEAVAGDGTVRITPTDAGAAKFEVYGWPEDQAISLSFSLPQALSSPSSSLSITFGASSAAWAYSDDPAAATTFDPSIGTTVTVSQSDQLFIWVGGSISPSHSQESGSYTEAITLTATPQ